MQRIAAITTEPSLELYTSRDRRCPVEAKAQRRALDSILRPWDRYAPIPSHRSEFTGTKILWLSTTSALLASRVVEVEPYTAYVNGD
jgi:hypothetical protein